MNRSIVGTVAVLAAIAALASCATGIGSRPAPGWVLQPPAPTDEFEYFVASATDDNASGDPAAAEEAAGYSLLAQINQALGVDIDVQTSAEARSTLDSYEATLVQQVTQSGRGRVEGLWIADRFIFSQDGRVTVYVLGEYERGAFEAERERRQAILRQQEDLILGPERQADQLVRDGRLAEALQHYAQAAAAAVSSELEIAPIVLERSVQKAVNAVSSLRLEAIGGPEFTDVGVAPAEPVLFLVSDVNGVPVAGAPIEVSYISRRGARDVVRTTTHFSDEAGIVAFAHPAPNRVGALTVTARLESGQLLPLFDNLPDELDASVRAFEAALVSVRATYEFIAQSRAREITTAVVVVDSDFAGNLIDGDTTAAGIVQALSGAGFRLRTTAIESRVVLEKGEAEMIAYLQSVLPAEIRRVVYGVAEVVDLQEDDGFLVKVRATVVAIELADGEILYSTSGVKNARSRTADRAISAALMELGIDLGEELAASLP